MSLDSQQNIIAQNIKKNVKKIILRYEPRESAVCTLHAAATSCPPERHFFKRCGNAVRTPLWCDRGFT